MPRPIQDQVVVITGASSGIGRQTALELGKLGAKVVLGARNVEGLETAAQQVRDSGGEALVVATDVSDWAQVEYLAQQAINVFGRIDTWVNNAGTGIYAPAEETTVEETRRVIDVNFMGVVHGVKAALPHLKRQGYGTIINVGSVESMRALPYHSAYAASKHAVKAYSDALRLELKHQKLPIEVTLVMPSGINTPFFNHTRSKIGTKPQPVPPAYEPELAAQAIISAAQRPQRDIYVGGAGWFFGLLERLSPKLADRFMVTGGSMFKMQKSGQPDDGRDTLFETIYEPGRSHGDFPHLTKPSLYTRLFELLPSWTRALLPIGAALGFAFVNLRRR